MSFRKKSVVLLASVSLLTMGAIGAAEAAHATPTDACRVQQPGSCLEPVVAQSTVSSRNFKPHSDAGLTVANLSMRPGTAVDVFYDNDLQDGTQDFAYNDQGYVGDGTDNLTAWDVNHFHGDRIINIEFTPFGQDTGLCLQPGRGTMVLQWCDGGADQDFILSRTAPFANPATHGYTFVFSALQYPDAQHHLALDAPQHVYGPVTEQRLINVSAGHASSFMWNAIP